MRILPKVKSLTDRLATDDLTYFDEQFMYGHREILLAYANSESQEVSPRSILHAGLTHGWGFDAGIWRMRNRNLTRAPRYEWNKKFEDLLPKKFKNEAIGSPWLYLLLQLGALKTTNVRHLERKRKKFLIMPGHNLLFTSKAIGAQAQMYFEATKGEPSTVCLFWLDFCDAPTRKAYEKLGFQVECMGFIPRGSSASSILGGRVTFLPSLFELMISHDELLTDELGSGVFYAASLGLPIHFLKDSEAEKLQSSMSHLMNTDYPGFYATSNDWLEDHSPHLWGSGLNIDLLKDMAWNELGEESLRDFKGVKNLTWHESTVSTESYDLFIQVLNNLKSKISITNND
jgi:hypothetical protein